MFLCAIQSVHYQCIAKECEEPEALLNGSTRLVYSEQKDVQYHAIVKADIIDTVFSEP